VSCGRDTQVCERQQREHLGGPVLSDAAIAHLSIAELALHDTKYMLNFRAHPCQTDDCGHAGGPSTCRRVLPSPSPPRARPPPPQRASSHRWSSPCRHRPRCHRGPNSPSPSHRARCRQFTLRSPLGRPAEGSAAVLGDEGQQTSTVALRGCAEATFAGCGHRRIVRTWRREISRSALISFCPP